MVFLRICKGTVGVSHRQTSVSRLPARIGRSRGVSVAGGEMGMMGKLRMFVVQEPVVAASCLIAGFGLFLPAVVRPILDSFEAAKQVPQTAGIVSTAGKDQ